MSFNLADVKKPLRHIKPHDHNCLIYKAPEEWRAAVIPFLRTGLLRGEKCLYITDDPSIAGQVRQCLLEEKVDADAAESSGQLAFFIRESLNEPAAGIINLLINETKKAVVEGYPLLRVTGEMIMPKSRPDRENLLAQEAGLNRDFFSEYPCVALCQYDRNKFAPEMIIEALKTHPFLVKGSLVRRNPYYIPPEKYLDPKRKDNEVDYLLDSLEQGENYGETVIAEAFAPYLFQEKGAHIWELTMANEQLQREITERKLAEAELMKSNTALATANEELIAINEELLSIEEELKQQYEKLQTSEVALASANQRLRDIIEFLPDPTFVIDNDKKVIAWNRAIEEMTGVPKEEILGKGDSAYAIPFYGKTHPILIDFAFKMHEGKTKIQYDSLKKEGQFVHGSNFVQRIYGGKGAYLWGIAAPLFDREGNLAGAIESIRNVTEQRQLENRLKYLGIYDSLTGLHNRSYFEEEMRRLEDGRNISAGIIVCDVDGLKLVNDTLGHETGDLLLIAAADIIKDSFRENDMVARIGGDEFAVLLPNAALLPNNEIKTMESVCDRIQEGVIRHNAARPELPLSISAGFAARNDGSISMSDLFREADNKMYREKLHRSQSARSAIVQTLMKALEARDFITEEHGERIQGFVSDLAAAIDLSEHSIADLRLLAQFHDIGKIGIPDSILLKPGSLTPEEFITMQQHCEIGHRIAVLSPDLFPIADWILKHHEWWNGHGYPLGLKGEEIPLECRILAIADAFDAMISDRPYRKAMTCAEALAELEKCAGMQFDPYLTGKFVQLHKNGRKKPALYRN